MPYYGSSYRKYRYYNKYQTSYYNDRKRYRYGTYGWY